MPEPKKRSSNFDPDNLKLLLSSMRFEDLSDMTTWKCPKSFNLDSVS